MIEILMFMIMQCLWLLVGCFSILLFQIGSSSFMNFSGELMHKMWEDKSTEDLVIHRGRVFIRLGLLIGTSEYGVKGKELWVVNSDRKENEEDVGCHWYLTHTLIIS